MSNAIIAIILFKTFQNYYNGQRIKWSIGGLMWSSTLGYILINAFGWILYHLSSIVCIVLFIELCARSIDR